MKKILQVLAFFLIISIIPTGLVKAEQSIEIDYFYGFNGYVLSERGFPLQITIKNNGNDFSGDLILKVPNGYSSGTSIKLDVDLLANSEATYTVYLPGISTNMNNIRPIISLYEGNFNQGKEVDFSGAKILAPKYYADNSNVIGTITSNVERTKFLDLLKGINYQMLLTKENFPKDSLGLEMFKMIVIDDIPLNTLSDVQLESLQQWINRGGILVSSTLQNQQSNLLPLTIESATSLTNSFQFNDKVFTESVRGYVVQVDETSTVVTSDEGLVAAKKEVGNGAVIQYNFVLGDNPLISWTDYPSWLSANLSKAGIAYNTDGFNSYVFSNSVNNLNYATQQFKAVSISLGTMSIILIVYLIIVTMVVYFVLKKKQKLELTWIVIPTIAIISSVVIFLVGAKDRYFESKLNQLAIYTNHDGYLNGIVAASLLSNKGGDVQLSINQSTPIFTTSDGYSYRDTQKHVGIVEIGNEAATISYEDINYWSTVSVAAQVEVQNAGMFKTDLVIKNGRLQGTITNNYSFDFDGLAIWSGNDYYELPGVATNETIDVDITVTSSLLTRPQYIDLYGQDLESIKLSATTNYIQNVMGMMNRPFFSKPAILAKSDEMLHSFALTNGNYSTDHLTVIYEPIDVTMVAEGEIILNSASLSHVSNALTGRIENSDSIGGWYYVLPGEYEFTYTLPNELKGQDIHLVDLEANIFNHDPSIEFYLYNYQTNEFVPVTTQKLIASEQDQFIQNHQMLLKLIKKDNNMSGDVNLPEMRMKVEVSK